MPSKHIMFEDMNTELSVLFSIALDGAINIALYFCVL